LEFELFDFFDILEKSRLLESSFYYRKYSSGLIELASYGDFLHTKPIHEAIWVIFNGFFRVFIRRHFSL
jgi:hypothetical protein